MTKKLFIGLLLAIPFVFTSSCSKESKGDIVGQWQYESIEIKGLPAELAPYFNADDIVEPCSRNSWLQFFEDGSFETMDACENGAILTGTWVKNGSNVTITAEGETQVMVIKSISDTYLTIDLTAEAEDMLPAGMKILMKFKRIG